MTKGDLILVIGGFAILALFTLSLNSSIILNQVTIYQSEHILDGLSIAQKYIEKAEALRFDEDKSATIPSSFTYSNNLGPDQGEQYPNFDDLDDFDGFSQLDTLAGNIPYLVTIDVNYVTLANPDTPTSTRTYFKRMLVTISSEHLVDIPSRSIEIKKLFSYHYFYTE